MTPDASSSPWPSRIRRWWPALALLAMTVAAYWPALHNGFIWDDDHYVLNDPLLRTYGCQENA